MQDDPVLIPGSVKQFGRTTLYSHERAAFDDAFQRVGGAEGTKVLDMGCGRGRTTAVLVDEYHADVRAFDIDAPIIAEASRARPDINYHVGDATHLVGYEDGSLDLVLFSFNGIDYIPTREARKACYSEAARVLRPGGAFVYSSHNRRALLANKDARRILRHNIWRLLTGAEMLYEPGRVWNLESWHGTPRTEALALADAGLQQVSVWSRRRNLPTDDPAAAKGEHWPYYVAVKR